MLNRVEGLGLTTGKEKERKKQSYRYIQPGFLLVGCFQFLEARAPQDQVG